MSSTSTFIIRRDPTLFLETRKYHSRELKKMFIKHYRGSTSNGKPNKKWTSCINSSDMHDLKVHLSWVIGMKVFNLSKEKTGKKILHVYKKTGELKFLMHVCSQMK
jgi:hypothetical protein